MTIRGYTAKLKLIKPEFDADTWHDYEYSNLETIDAVLGTITGLSVFMGEWKNSTQYHKGEVVTNSSTMYIVNEDHITDAQQSFEDYWLEHPTFYQDWNGVTKSREWATKIDGVVDDILGDDYSSKAYAISAELISDGSAKEWAINDEDTAIGETGEYSAKHYALKAEQIHDSIVEDENVIAVGEDLRDVNSNVKIVGLSIDNVNKTGNSIGAVESVAEDLDLGEDSAVKIVAEDLSGPASTQFVKKVAEDIDSVKINAQYKTQIDTNANNMTAINIAAGIAEDISTTANIGTKVSAVADNETNINDVADDLPNIDAVAGQLSELAQMAHKDLDNLTTSGETHIGIKGYDATRTFKTNDVVSLVDGNGDTKLYKSLVDNNIGNPVSDTTKWAEVLLGSKIDNITIQSNNDKEIEVHGVLDAMDSKAMKFVECTVEQYEQWKADGELLPNTFYWKNDEVSTNVKSFRNVGDIFYTMRLDTYLNGAVGADGTEYDTRDYVGADSIGACLSNGKLPYVSYAEYASEISAHGVCGKFAWDGGNKFKVPTINAIYIEANSNNVGEFSAESLPNINGEVGMAVRNLSPNGCFQTSSIGAVASVGANGVGVNFNASRSSSTYQNGAKVKTDRIKYRAMIQLATQTTDEAIADMTQLSTDVHSFLKNDYDKQAREDNDTYLFGYVWDTLEADPAKAITYPEGVDNFKYRNCYMNKTLNIFQWGDWLNVPFLPKPCALTFGGVVDYYLDPNDYTKKVDGSVSDVSNSAYNGNFMMEWDTIYRKKFKENNYIYCYFSNKKLDNGYECWSTKKADGTYADHFYTAIYQGTSVSNKLRSYSSGGKCWGNTGGASNERTQAAANGTGWDIRTVSDSDLIIDLYLLMFKHTNSQQQLGICPDSTSGLTLNCGQGNQLGMFYGSNSGVIKLFGMENWYGHRWEREVGLINRNGIYYIKHTKSTIDGSTATSYNLDGTGYKNTGLSVPTASQSYIYDEYLFDSSFLPRSVGGSATTYTCDGMWSNNGQVDVLIRGGSVYDGSIPGVLCFNVSDLASRSNWSFGTSLSYHLE